MYQKNEFVIYGERGVCRVEDICTPEGLPGVQKGRLYYKLTPIREAGTIYIPVDTNVFMRPVITKEEAEELISQIPRLRESQPGSRNAKEMEEYYKDVLHSHNCLDLLELIRAVYVRSQNSIQNGKKPGQVDMRYQKRAEELLHGELAVVLQIPTDQVAAYIETKVSEMEKSKVLS